MMLNAAIEAMTEPEKEELQDKKLKKTLERAYKKTLFYKERMEALGVTPSDISSIHDIRKLPFMTAADLSKNYPFGLLTIPISGVARFQQTTDFIGAVGFTQNDLAGQMEMIARNLVACHINMTSVLMILPETGTYRSNTSLQQAAEGLSVAVISSNNNDIKSQLKTMFDFRVTTVFSTPAPLFLIADYLENNGFLMQDLPLLSIVCEAQHCSPALREKLFAKFRIPIYLLFGRLDIMDLGIAGECQEQLGLHIQEDHFYPEIINPNTGKVIPDGLPGELVLTTLTREATPLIRYRTGENVVITRERCSCGRTLARLTFVP